MVTTAEKVNLIKNLLGQAAALIGSLDGDVGWETCVKIDAGIKILKDSFENLEDRVLFRDSTGEEPLPMEAMEAMAILTKTLEQGNEELVRSKEWLEKYAPKN